MSRFHRRFRHIVVTLADVNGPCGGIDKLCHVVVCLGPCGDVVIEEVERDFTTAIARAAERAGRAVRRAVERRREAKTKGPGMSPHEDASWTADHREELR